MYTNLFTFISEVFGQPKVNYHSLKDFFLRHRVNARIEFPFCLVSYQILCQDPPPHPIFFWSPKVWAEPLSAAWSRPPAPDLSSRLQAPARRRLGRSVPHRRRPGSLLSSISRGKKKKKKSLRAPPRMKSNLLLDFGVWSRRREARRRRLGWGPGGSSPPRVDGGGGGGHRRPGKGVGGLGAAREPSSGLDPIKLQ